jgi:hypothetical protein
MTSECEKYRTRIVTVGMRKDGRSCVVSDAPGEVRYPSPIITSTAVWEADTFPVTIGADHTPDIARYLQPAGGFRVFMSSFSPTKSWSSDPALMAQVAEAAGLAGPDDGGPAGFHQTPTVDIVVLIAGEIYLLLDEGEVLLRPGDALVLQGAPHAWDNRSGQEAIFLCIMVDAKP